MKWSHDFHKQSGDEYDRVHSSFFSFGLFFCLEEEMREWYYHRHLSRNSCSSFSQFTWRGLSHGMIPRLGYSRKREHITDGGLKHWREIHTLYMSGSSQLTDDALENLKGIHNFKMRRCSQISTTEKQFAYLKGIQILNMNECNQKYNHRWSICSSERCSYVEMNYCSQSIITDQAFEHLHGILTQEMQGIWIS